MARHAARSALLLARPTFQQTLGPFRNSQLATPPRPSLTYAVKDFVSVATEAEDVLSSSPIAEAVKDAAKILPKQAILDNFVHHNPYENLQHLSFSKAMKHVHQVRSHMSPGARLSSLVNVDPRLRSSQAVSELSAAFLDRGAAKWEAPHRDKGFLYFFASLESLGFAPWRGHARTVASRVLSHVERHPHESLDALAATIVQEDLVFFGASPEEWTVTLRSMLLDLEGWAGMFERMDPSTPNATQSGPRFPDEAPTNAKVRLLDFCAVQLILVRSSIESLARQSGWDTLSPLGQFLSKAPATRDMNEYHQNPSGLAFVDQNWDKQEKLEMEYEGVALRALCQGQEGAVQHRPILQLWTCIDEREESFRRHVEEATGNPSDIETFGIAGFMGFQLHYEYKSTTDSFLLGRASKFGKPGTIMAPEGVQPPSENTFTEEEHRGDLGKAIRFSQRHRFMARLALLWENASFSPLGSLAISSLFPVSVGRLLLMSFFPSATRIMTESFIHEIAPKPRTDFSHSIPPETAAKLLSVGLKNMRHTKFAPIVMVLGHGSKSANNPYDAAYNCGACGGREGGPNARIMARCANDEEVRMHLSQKHGIDIPDDTWFVGGKHDTTSELVELFDVETLPDSHTGKFSHVMDIINKARGQNALERSKRFMLANAFTPEEALQHVRTRSTDLGEARPELNHATNAAVVVGRRSLTKGRNLSRRMFLPSYDPFVDDDQGTNLEQVLMPALIVCSGINLEYFFSTVEGGAGTKMPMNLVGHLGVQQGAAGDLLHGLPTQTTEMHVPIRALFIIDAPVKRLQAVLARREILRNIVHNDWIRLIVRDPVTKRLKRQSGGEYLPIYQDGYLDTTTKKDATTFVPFTHHTNYGQLVAHKEALFAGAAGMGMLLSCGLPVHLFGLEAMHAQGALVAVAGTTLSLAALGFSRRYLHGEFMFGRQVLLSASLLAGFNIVATAPAVDMMMLGGWGLMAYSSAFLIGVFNDRPTARENATYAFFVYKMSDLALITAAAFSTFHLANEGHAAFAASGLIAAALLKSSQFPATNLFVRCIEGATPTTAIAYAGISAHAGVVLLSATTSLWFDFEWARACVASVGAVTAVHAGLAAKIRPDRKGALANATASTLGMIYVILAAGYTDTALALSLGHAALRMTQFLRSPNFMLDTRNLKSALGNDMGSMMEPKRVRESIYRVAWAFNRVNSDLRLPHMMHMTHMQAFKAKPLELSKSQQWSLTGVLVVLSGLPFTPVSHVQDHLIMEMLHTSPYVAGASMGVYAIAATMLIRTVFTRVLDFRRFRHEEPAVTHPMPAAQAAQVPEDPAEQPVSTEIGDGTETGYSWRTPDDLDEYFGSYRTPDELEWGSYRTPDDLGDADSDEPSGPDEKKQ